MSLLRTYVVVIHYKLLGEALLISTHNICFCREIRNNINILGLNKHLIWSYVLIIIVIIVSLLSLRKRAYSIILKILQPKKGNFQIKNSDIFHISSQNIDCEYSLELPQ